MHFRTRSYDPRLGRFLEKEGKEEKRAVDHYRYTANSPVNHTDPTCEEVRVHGSEPGLSVFRKFLAAATKLDVDLRKSVTPGSFVVDLEKGRVPSGKNEKALVDAIRDPLDSRNVVDIKVEIASPYLIDDFDTRTLDISDLIEIERINRERPLPPNLPYTPAAQHLIHVFSEYVEGWNPPVLDVQPSPLNPAVFVNLGYQTAHRNAIGRENSYRRSLGLLGEVLNQAAALPGSKVAGVSWVAQTETSYRVGSTVYAEGHAQSGAGIINRRALFERTASGWSFVKGDK
jgi:hypothetical protein